MTTRLGRPRSRQRDAMIAAGEAVELCCCKKLAMWLGARPSETVDWTGVTHMSHCMLVFTPQRDDIQLLFWRIDQDAWRLSQDMI
jgi:hypothetical protein